MTCGKICSGKSTYAKQIYIENHAVILSVDEIMLSIFGQHSGEKHDEYVEKIEKFLFTKSVEIVKVGVNVILDWGFWTKNERIFAKEFYTSKGIECEFHYIDISDEVWKSRLITRNKAVLSNEISAYFIDDNLAKKFNSIFEKPSKDEIDLWIKY